MAEYLSAKRKPLTAWICYGKGTFLFRENIIIVEKFANTALR